MSRLITNHRQFGSIIIVDLRGRIDLGEASLTLRHTIRDLAESGRTKIILNFSAVNSVDSAGVGELAGAHMPVKSKGGELKFLNPTKKVHGMRHRSNSKRPSRPPEHNNRPRPSIRAPRTASREHFLGVWMHGGVP